MQTLFYMLHMCLRFLREAYNQPSDSRYITRLCEDRQQFRKVRSFSSTIIRHVTNLIFALESGFEYHWLIFFEYDYEYEYLFKHYIKEIIARLLYVRLEKWKKEKKNFPLGGFDPPTFITHYTQGRNLTTVLWVNQVWLWI